MHGIIELVSKYLRRTHNDRRVRIFLPIAGQDSTMVDTKFVTEFEIDGIGKGLEGRSVPRPQPLGVILQDRLRSDPGLPRPGWCADKDIKFFDLFQGLDLKGIRFERCTFRDTDLFEDLFELRV